MYTLAARVSRFSLQGFYIFVTSQFVSPRFHFFVFLCVARRFFLKCCQGRDTPLVQRRGKFVIQPHSVRALSPTMIARACVRLCPPMRMPSREFMFTPTLTFMLIFHTVKVTCPVGLQAHTLVSLVWQLCSDVVCVVAT